MVQWRSGKITINYLDDYLFAAAVKRLCDHQINIFLQICKDIEFLVAMEKTFWGDTILTFLGLLVDTINQIISIPCEKIAKAINMIQFILDKRSKGKALKITVLQLQKICGFLNFLGRAVVPGRVFT